LGQTVSGFRFDAPGPSKYSSVDIKKAWPKTYQYYALLAGYPKDHEVIGCHWKTDTRLYDGHNTHVTFNWYNRYTNELIFTYEVQIPDPSEYGYTYWNSYNVWSWVDHSEHEIAYRNYIDLELAVTSNTLGDWKHVKSWSIVSDIDPPSQVTCTPGEQKCIGDDLYKCNAAGNDWVLVAENSPSCKYQGPCPNWWDDLPGFVYCFVLKSIEAALGLVTGGFMTLQLNVKNFLDNFLTDIVSFLGDIKGQVEAAIGGAIATLSYVTNTVTTYIADWWADTVDTISTWMSDAWTDITDFWNDVMTHIGDWWDNVLETLQRGWDNIISDLQDWWTTQIETLQRGWDNVIEGLQDWLDDQITILQRGWDNVVDGITTWFNDQIEILQRGWDNVVSNLTEWWDNVAETMQRGIDNIASDVSYFIDTTIPEWADYVSTQLGEFWEAIPGHVEDLFDALVNANPVMKFLLDMITGTFMDTEENKRRQQEVLDKRREIRELIERME